MDIAGEHQLDVSHNIYKKRLSPDGIPLIESTPIKDQGNVIIATYSKINYFIV